MPDVVENYMGIPGLNLGRRFFVDVLECPFTEAIKPYTKPVRVIHGTADQLVPLATGEIAAAMYQQSRLIIVQDGEHGFQIDASTVNDVVEFLQV